MSKFVAFFGECMLELQGQAFGPLQQSQGGDTYNSAVYLARCGAARGLRVAYASALGTDALSQAMLARWADEGLETQLVRQIPGKLPGLYWIELDARGERQFHFWRNASAARQYFDVDPSPVEAAAAQLDAFYCSGIGLAILEPAARERLLGLMERLRARGTTVVFDNNFRPSLWPDTASARPWYVRAFAAASLALITLEDHQALLGGVDEAAALADARALGVPECVVKRGARSTLIHQAGTPDWLEVPVTPVAQVVDTTAAGDAFAAGYLSRRLHGTDAPSSAAFGNALAGRVIQHRGAVIPRATMQDLVDAV